MTTTKRYSPEVHERAINLVLETQQEHHSQWEAIRSIVPKIGCIPEMLRIWVRGYGQHQALKNGLTTA